MDKLDTTSPEGTGTGDITRRDLIKGAAATGIILGTDEYVKPALRALGVTRLMSATSAPPGGGNPPPVPGTPAHGCTPGFWGNNSSRGQGGGVAWWNAVNAQQWHTNGGNGANPFSHGTSFNSFFTSASEMNGMTMWDVVNGGSGSNPARACARQLVAAYLNASFGTYGFSTSSLRSMWTAATNTSGNGARNTALRSLQSTLESANVSCDSG